MRRLSLPGLARTVRSLIVRAGEASFRFPVAAFAVAGLAIVANLAVIDGALPEGTRIRVMLSLIAGAAASVAATLFVESRNGRAANARLAGLLAFLSVAALVAIAQPLALYGSVLTLAVLAIVPLSPFVGRGSSRAFWNFALWTWLGVLLGFLSVLIFLIGFSAIFEMVRYLFRVGLGSRAYAHLFATGLAFVGPLFALSRIPHPLHATIDDPGTERLTKTVRPLFEWVMAPLVLVAAVIIHLYVGRIILSGDVPANEIGWVVLLFVGFVLSLRVALEPFAVTAVGPAGFFLRGWMAILVAPLLLIGFALYLRVEAEGWTVERYYAAAYALAAAIAVLLQGVPRIRGDIRFLVALPPVCLLLSAIGPWGVTDTVARSQAGLISRDYSDPLRGGPTAVGALPIDRRMELESRLDALDNVRRTDRLSQQLAAFPADAAGDRVAALRLALQLGSTDTAGAGQARSVRFATIDPLDISGYDQVVPGISASTIGLQPALARLEGGHLIIEYRGIADRFDLGIEPSDLSAAPDASRPERVVDQESSTGRRIRLRLSSATWGDDGALLSISGTLALRDRDWDAGPPPG